MEAGVATAASQRCRVPQAGCCSRPAAARSRSTCLVAGEAMKQHSQRNTRCREGLGWLPRSGRWSLGPAGGRSSLGREILSRQSLDVQSPSGYGQDPSRARLKASTLDGRRCLYQPRPRQRQQARCSCCYPYRNTGHNCASHGQTSGSEPTARPTASSAERRPSTHVPGRIYGHVSKP